MYKQSLTDRIELVCQSCYLSTPVVLANAILTMATQGIVMMYFSPYADRDLNSVFES